MSDIGDWIRGHSPSLPVPAIFFPFHRELPVKLTNQVGRYYHMTFQNGARHRKLFLDRRKRSQFDHTVVRKAMLIWCNVERLHWSSQEGRCVSRNPCLRPYFSHYCPTFQNASWSALAAKLWQQPTIFFASLSPFCSVTLVHAIFTRHPEVPHCRDRRKKSPSVSAVIFATAIGL